MNQDERDPKDRILDAATSLFAQRGFHGVGVREIASAANVNVAMISYYFNGKVGILQAIMDGFFERYMQLLDGANDLSKSPEECLRELVRRIIHMARENTDATLVTYHELPLDNPEIRELKAERVSQLVSSVGGLIARFGFEPTDRFPLSIVGPSLISMIFGALRNRPVLQHVFQIEFDDAYYERYADAIATLFLDGVHGFASELGE